jgi:hypothetical protein
VSYDCLDKTIAQLCCRFKCTRRVGEYFSIIFPKSLLALTDKELEDEAITLLNKQEKGISEELSAELLQYFRLDLENMPEVYRLSTLFICERSDTCKSFQDAETVITLFLTIPAVLAERSFSKFKLIKAI